MNISDFIKSHRELDELPFLIVYRTILVLREMGMLKMEANTNGVESSQS